MATVVVGVAGFIGALLIAAITSWLQQRNWRNQERVKASDRDRDSAIAVVTELSELLGKRIYRQKRFIYAVRDRKPTSDPDIVEYRAALLDWNDKLNNLQTRLDYSFGRGTKNEVERIFQNTLAAINSDVELVRNNKTNVKLLTNCERRLNGLTGYTNEYIDGLLARVRSMQIEGHTGRDTISYSNRANLSIPFLISRLLGWTTKQH